MKKKQHYLAFVLVLTGLAVLAPGSPATAGTLVPLQGQENGEFISDLSPFVFPFAHDGVSGEGIASEIGHYTLNGTFVANVLLGTAAGPFTMTADNGDMIFLNAVGGVVPADLSKVTWNLTVSGGTGRFADETGSFTSQVQLDAVVGSKSPNPYTATLNGAISQVPEGGTGYGLIAASALAGFGLLKGSRKTKTVRL